MKRRDLTDKKILGVRVMFDDGSCFYLGFEEQSDDLKKKLKKACEEK